MSKDNILEPGLKEKLSRQREQEWRKALRRDVSARKRLESRRHKMPEQPAAQRAANFLEVNLGYSLEMAREEAQRCLDCGDPGCVSGCPVAIDIPTFIKYIESGEIALASGHSERDQWAASNLRPGLPPGSSVREKL